MFARSVSPPPSSSSLGAGVSKKWLGSILLTMSGGGCQCWPGVLNAQFGKFTVAVAFLLIAHHC